MGTTHSLVKIDIGESFDMGKGFCDLFEHEPFLLRNVYRTPSDLAQAIEKTILSNEWNMTKTEAFKYSHDIAQKIYDWARWDRLLYMSDQSIADYENNDIYKTRYDSKFEGKFIETGNRYL